MYKLSGTSDVIYITDIYSKKEVQKYLCAIIQFKWYKRMAWFYGKYREQLFFNIWSSFQCLMFFIFQNQSATGNVIQLINNKAEGLMAHLIAVKSTFINSGWGIVAWFNSTSGLFSYRLPL